MLRRGRYRLFDAPWYERKYGVPRRRAELHYRREGHRLGYAPTPLFDVDWYAERYGRTEEPPLSELERNAARRAPNRWLDPATLLAAGVGEDEVLDRLAAARSHLEDPRTLSPAAPAIVDEWPGRRPVEPGATVVVLAHFDPRGVVASFEALVSEFVDSGCEVVVCSTSIGDPRLADAVREQVVSVCRVPNTGLDWGAYQAGLRYVLERFEPASVILANDSVYVIDGRLGAFIRRLEALPADLAGATDSDELGPHLQSYVLRLGPRALSGALTHELLTTYVPISVKELVIHSYELGFSRRGRLHGLDLAAVHPVSALSERAARTSAATESVLRRISEGTAVSPTLHLWKPLLEDGFPFVKRQLIRDRIASRDELLRFVPERTLALAEEDIRGRA